MTVNRGQQTTWCPSRGSTARNCGSTLWLTAGVHFIQVAKWLGHSSYVLTLTTYADYIPDVETENPLPEPVAAVPDTNVLPLHRAN
jgi:integrase